MTYLENLTTRRDAIATKLAAMDGTNSTPGDLPTTSGEGVNVDHVGYKDGLYRELDRLNALIDAAQDSPIVESEEFA